MREKPNLHDEKIIACLQNEYGLLVVQLTFLPIGWANTAVYRVVADDATLYFCKLRRDIFDETSVLLPKFLSDQGIAQIIPPLPTKTAQLWTNLDAFKLILYPFVEGRNGFQDELSDRHWRDFGAALKKIHTAVLPPTLISRIPHEKYSPQWREIVKTFLKRVEDDAFADPIKVKSAAFLRARRDEFLDLVGRAERLAQALASRSPEFILCHSDLHAGNILIDANDNLFIVDWDNPIFAPKERDLMFIGGGVGGIWKKEREAALFYQGYGQTETDSIALAYYRYERIIEDIAVECEQIFLTNEGGQDREQALDYLKSNFLPNSVLEIAYKSDKTSRDGYLP
ncbi:MAG: aminoglycoside phosphotransferase family protein [Chloroflexi bacterium]|nr:aminoglycoside phosphotransferase family protein [Chloroflexota bacterium]